MVDVVLSENQERFVATTHYFTAAHGVLGQQAAYKTPIGVLSPALSSVVFCVITLRNGVTFVGEARDRPNTTSYSFAAAKQRAANKAYRKVKTYLNNTLAQHE